MSEEEDATTKVSETTTTTTTTETEETGPEEKETAANVKKLLHDTKVDGGKSVWAMTMDTFGMAEGKKKKGDTICGSFEEAMDTFRSMVEGESGDEWKLEATPLTELGATKDDLYRSFVLWAHKEQEDGYNVSKAFRRIQSYVEWMEQHKTDLLGEDGSNRLTTASMRDLAAPWGFCMTHDRDKRLVWWFDLTVVDSKRIQQTPVTDTLRFFVWCCHVVLFDQHAQQHGMVMVEELNRMGIIQLFTFLPPDVSAKLDRLTIGILPIRMAAIYILGAGRWMHIIINLLKPFMSKKMRQRIVVLRKKDDPQAMLVEALGPDCIPKEFTSLDGTAEQDLLQTYFS